MRAVSHIAGRVSAGMASESSRSACSRVKLLRGFEGRGAGSSTSAAGLRLASRWRRACWHAWLR